MKLKGREVGLYIKTTCDRIRKLHRIAKSSEEDDTVRRVVIKALDEYIDKKENKRKGD